MLLIAGLQPHQWGIAQNQDKGLSRDMLVILAEFSLKSVAAQTRPSYYGDLFSAASLLQTRLTARLRLILVIHQYSHHQSCEELMCFTACPWSF